MIQVHVQSDPAGCLVISGQPAELDNPWGVTPFKKVCQGVHISITFDCRYKNFEY